MEGGRGEEREGGRREGRREEGGREGGKAGGMMYYIAKHANTQVQVEDAHIQIDTYADARSHRPSLDCC